ncbi:Brp/Blh family beta-carotene 15,15'-dioxygenase [Rubrobacter aplysinae]|uniref:Brp/Blh family beta-carotene 15,15'-dioxygenase n=1 Tax=Rubrobacter aplysinae TaxID=909625 RepID=UPI00064BCC0C|nr:Brp/Blh family beta-carotene 15,15'-dioxygenase [Rubrobacter aplysinae]
MGPADSGTPAARRTLLRGIVVPSWVALLGVTLPFALGFEIPDGLGWVQYVPFAASLVLFGLPHGAADHLVPGRLSGRGVGARSVAGVVALYLLLGGAYLALWTVSPLLSFTLFILFTLFHWGQGDLYSSKALIGVGGPPVAAGILVRGGLPMLVPLLAFPAVYAGVGESLVGLFGGSYPDPLPGGVSLALRLCGGLAMLALALLYLRGVYRRTSSLPRLAAEAGEISLLAAYFSVVPPILAVGIYFCLWHSPRHIARLMLLDPASVRSLENGGLAPALRRFARDAAPLTLAALVLLAVLYLYVPSGPGGASGLLAGYLVLISTLTLPHVVLVTWMDLRQGVWGAKDA